MKGFYRFLLILLLAFSSVAPFLYGNPAHAADLTPNMKFSLSFTPSDTVLDPNKPVIYMTDGSKSVYAVNYVTKEIKTLKLAYPANQLALYKNILCVTQKEMKSSIYSNGPYTGAIAEIDTNHFTLSKTLAVKADPFDIAVDENGNLYISSASGQGENIKVYSLLKNIEVPYSGNVGLYAGTYIFYNSAASKIYSISTALSPNRLIGMEVKNGIPKQDYYDDTSSSYKGSHPFVKVSPDGSSLYDNLGNVMESTMFQSGDMVQRFTLGKSYNDYAFSVQNGWVFGAASEGGIDVYQLNSNHLLNTFAQNQHIDKLFYQSGLLVAINKSSVQTFNVSQLRIPNSPYSNSLGFTPYDTAIDPNMPVIYMTRLGSKTIYAVNYSSGEMKTLKLPYPAERLELYQNKLYITQQKMPHEYYTTDQLVGAIAEVNTSNFTLNRVIDINTDPYDLAVLNGYLYITPGSNQWEDMKVYSLETGNEVKNNTAFTNLYMNSSLYADSAHSQLYAIDSPSMYAFNVKDGVVEKKYLDPNYGTYDLRSSAKITPDGESIYNQTGIVYNLSQPNMSYAFKLLKSYNDYAFNVNDQLTYAANTDGGIDVYKYGTNEYLYTLRKDLQVLKLHVQNGQLLAICTNNLGKYFIEKIQGASDESIQYLESVSGSQMLKGNYDYHPFYNGVKNVPLSSFLAVHFNQPVYLYNVSNITVNGPSGLVKGSLQVLNDTLTFTPELLKSNAVYTLTIKNDALADAQGQHLAKDITIQFQTGTNWEMHGGKEYYFDPSVAGFVTKWKKINNGMYYFNENGEMQMGWNSLNNAWYYFSNNGAMKTGWFGAYYLDPKTGARHTGWVQINKSWYYFDLKTGVMKTGLMYVDKKWHYFDSKTGALKIGWVQVNKKRWYSYPK